MDQKLAENPPKDSASTEGRSSGEAMSVVREGSRAHKRGDYAEALRLFRLAAEQGEADAQSWLGLMYSLGRRRINQPSRFQGPPDLQRYILVVRQT